MSATSEQRDLFFPRASQYDRAWVEANFLGKNVLQFVESLTEVLALEPGMRVLDLGCGHAVKLDLPGPRVRCGGLAVWRCGPCRGVSPSENFKRIEKMGCADRVFPLRAHAAAPLRFGR